MSAPVLNSAGDSTPGRLGCVDINLTFPLNTGAPVWTPIQYIQSSNFQPDDPAMVDATVFGDGGYSGQDKLGAAWSLGLTLSHMIVPGSTPPIYDPTHDFLELHGVAVFGAANRVQLRMYDFDVNDPTGALTPRGQAYMGFANYNWPAFGDIAQADARKVALTFMGKGKLNKITHPFPVAAAVPVIYSVTPLPLLAAGGTVLRVLGSGFTGLTALTIAGNTVASGNRTVVNDSELIAVAPAHAAGTGLPIVATNATGASTTGATMISYA